MGRFIYTIRTLEFLSLNPTYGLWPHSNYGQDIIIGIIDSDICPESLSFNNDNITTTNPLNWNGSCDEGDSSICNLKSQVLVTSLRVWKKNTEKYVVHILLETLTGMGRLCPP